MANIILIRHIPTKSNITGFFMGDCDIEPEIEDHKDLIMQFREYIEHMDVCAVYSSNLKRCFLTVDAIFENRASIIKKSLKEKSLGNWAGRNKYDVMIEHPKWFNEKGWCDIRAEIEGGEEFVSFCCRVMDVVQEINDVYQDDDSVVVCTHAGVMAMLFCLYENKLYSNEPIYTREIKHVYPYILDSKILISNFKKQ